MLITKQIKTYFRIAVLAIVIILSGTTAFFYNQNKKNKLEAERHYNNFNNANFEVKEMIAKNGKLYNQVNSITLERNELKNLNVSLYEEIKNQNTKIKNLEATLKMQYAYIIRIDSMAIKDTVYINSVNAPTPMKYVLFDDPYLYFYAKIDSTQLKNIRINVYDSIMVTTETKYKGFWFWRKPVYSIVKITNESPYFILNKVETIKFK